MQGVVTSVGGYSTVTIAPTGSMRKSGFKEWDVVMVQKVNPRSLKGDVCDEDGNVLVRGDIIAYYRYYDSGKNVKTYRIYTPEEAETESKNANLSVGQFFGTQNNTIKNAAKSNADMIFHHIKEIREDSNGKLYFKTYGSSNASEDTYWISEDVIVGEYCDGISPIILEIFKLFATQAGIFFLICIPLMLILIMVVIDILGNMALAGIESKVLKGELALDDPVCVMNHIGIRMSKKNKYKVLAQLSPQERIESVSYLWQSPKDIQYMKKYYIKQKLLLHYDEERLNLKNEYAEKMRTGKGARLTAFDKEYRAKLKDIDKREQATIKKLKEIAKKAHTESENHYNDMDMKHALNNARVKLKKGETFHIGPHKSAEARKIVQRIEKSATAEIVTEGELSNVSIDEAVDTFKANKAQKNNK